MSFEDKDINRVKESFDSLNREAPDFVWENLNRQLHIDRTWLKIKSRLDRIQQNRKRKEIAFYFSLIFLMLLSASLVWLFSKRESLSKGSLFVKHSYYGPLVSIDKQPNFSKTKNIETNAQKNPNNNSRTINTTPALFNYWINKTKTKTNASIIKTLPESNNGDSVYVQKENTTVLFSELVKDSLFKTPVVAFNNFPYSPSRYLCIKNNLFNDSSHFPLKQKRKVFSVGVIYALSSSLLINEEFRASNNEESLTSLTPGLSSGYGLVCNIAGQKNNSFDFEFFIKSRQSQHLQYYERGRYYNKTTVLEYSKIALMYQKDFYVFMKKPTLHIAVKGGGYFSYLTKDKVSLTYNDVEFSNVSSDYSNLDYGLKLCTSFEKDVKRFVMGFGLHAEYGIKNIFTGNSTIPMDFNNTQIFNHGAYITFRYRL
ncbi:MAG: hypothetical protein V2A54_17070 [Bacteroidota bacterium]